MADEEELREVAAAIAPYVIPDILIEAWRRLGVRDWLVDHGQLQAPQEALQSWGLVAGSPPMPRPLFPISYGSHTFLFIELSMPGGPSGGALLLAPIAEPLIRHAPSLAWAFDFVSSQLESGVIRWDGEYWAGNDEVERDLQAASERVSWPPHLLPAIDPSSPLSWPSHWRQANGIDPAWAKPLGANASVQDLFGLGSGDSRRIHVRVVGLTVSGAGSRTDVADDSGKAVVWVPSAADPFFVVRMGDKVELDVEVAEAQVKPDANPVVAMFDKSSYRFRSTMARPLS